MFSDGWLRPRKQGSGGVSKSIKGPSWTFHSASFIEPFRREIALLFQVTNNLKTRLEACPFFLNFSIEHAYLG